jgi:hypothetical protein
MVVLVRRLRIDPPAPAHAEVEDQRMIAIGVDQPVFRAAREARDSRPGQRLHQAGGKGSAHVGAVDAHADDPLALEEPGQPAHGGFDFWELGHLKISSPQRKLGSLSEGDPSFRWDDGLIQGLCPGHNSP